MTPFFSGLLHFDIRDAVMLAYLWVAGMAALIGVPEMVRLVRYWNRPDPWLPYRLFTVLVLGVLMLVKIWRALIWFDWTYYRQELFGSIDTRIPYELVLLLLFVGAMTFAVLLYWFPQYMVPLTFRMFGRRRHLGHPSKGVL